MPAWARGVKAQADDRTSAAIRRKSQGATAAELRAEGFDAAQLKAAGFNLAQLKAAGFCAMPLKAAGFLGVDLIFAGVWGACHSSYDGKVQGGAITAGCGERRWATGEGTLPAHGKYRIQYEVNSTDSGDIADIRVGVASRAARVDQQDTWEPQGCYFWLSHRGGDGTFLVEDGTYVKKDIPQESHAGSIIEVIVDQSAATVEFRLDGAPVGGKEAGTKLKVKREHQRDLTPAACVYWEPSAVTLVAVEAMGH